MSEKVVVFGAGRVAGPCVQFLLKKGYSITVGSPVQKELDQMKQSFPDIAVRNIDVSSTAELIQIISQQAVVVSLVPPDFMKYIAEACIECKKNFVSASYINGEMQKLHDRAVEAGVVLLNECGLDPGVDHAIAMSYIDAIKKKQGEVTSFTSLCGGIPAPESSHDVMRYKFSWFPKGMLHSVTEKAKYLKDGKIIQVQASCGYDSENVTEVSGIIDNETFEVIPNRDSTEYLDLYGIQTAQSIFRGTLRYKGFSKVMRLLVRLGLVTEEPSTTNLSWRQFVCNSLGLAKDALEESMRGKLLNLASNDEDAVEDIIRLGLFEDEPMPNLGSPMDDLGSLMGKKLAYGPGERDMVVMRTLIEGKYPDGSTERHVVDLIDYGQVNGYSAMARTVGIPVGLAAHLLIQGAVKRSGVLIPRCEEIYKPLLDTLAQENIILKCSSQVDK